MPAMAASGSKIWDAVVVGAGPAGCAAARLLAEAGLSTVLIEKEPLPRYKTCGGGLIARALAELPETTMQAVERVCHTATMQVVGSRRGYRAERPAPVVSMVMRERLDALLAEAAVRAGAELRDGTAVTHLNEDANGVTLHTGHGSLRARLLVAADGVNGPCARAAGWPRYHPAPAVEWEVETDSFTMDRLDGTARFDLWAVPGGYGWVFPKKTHLSVGMVAMQPRPRNPAIDLNGATSRYLQGLGISFHSAARHGHRIPIIPRSGPPAKGRVFLTGDALGLADAVTAEGISSALISGRLAAEAIVAMAAEPQTAAGHYARRLALEVFPDLAVTRLLGNVVYRRPWLVRAVLDCFSEPLGKRLTDVITGQRRYRDLGNRLRPFWHRLARITGGGDQLPPVTHSMASKASPSRESN
ncbi:MAG: geranylgeranyl reductase family protein [Leptospirillia bacterium]